MIVSSIARWYRELLANKRLKQDRLSSDIQSTLTEYKKKNQDLRRPWDETKGMTLITVTVRCGSETTTTTTEYHKFIRLIERLTMIYLAF